MFIDTIYEQAKENLQTIALPESTNPVILKAAAKAQADGLANVVLIGDPAEIQAKAWLLSLSHSEGSLTFLWAVDLSETSGCAHC